jgi:hypothetical protein
MGLADLLEVGMLAPALAAAARRLGFLRRPQARRS